MKMQYTLKTWNHMCNTATIPREELEARWSDAFGRRPTCDDPECRKCDLYRSELALSPCERAPHALE